MKCQGCGHEYPSTFPRCSRCGELNQRRTQRPSPSRLIEFPLKARPNVEEESSERPLPPWRKELNEKVRAVRARRNTTGADPAPQPVPPQKEIRRPVNVNLSRGETLVRKASAPAPGRGVPTSPDSRDPEITPQTNTSSKTSTAIVEAALTRVQRASESAYRTSLARPEPPRSAQPQPSPTIVLDNNQATARALETSTEIVTGQVPKVVSRLAPEPSAARESTITLPTPPIVTPNRIIESLEKVQDIPIDDEIVRVSLPAVDEIEPYDYLEREIQRIDRTHSQEFAHNESASLVSHVIIGVVDILTVSLSSLPFIAVLQLMNGDIGDRRTQVAAALILLLVSFFYLAVTHCLVSKTFGMMLTNTRVVDANTFDPPSGQRLLLRTISYFVALAPVALGFLWILFDPRRRGWHDFISGTRVVRDF